MAEYNEEFEVIEEMFSFNDHFIGEQFIALKYEFKDLIHKKIVQDIFSQYIPKCLDLDLVENLVQDDEEYYDEDEDEDSEEDEDEGENDSENDG